MDSITSREYHPAANIFPLLQGDEFDQLKTDIKQNGLLEPIWLHPDGRIIDGRNRYRACLAVDVKPQFRTWQGGGSLVSFVVSLNLHRRHLNSSQRAALAVDILPMLEEEARERAQEAARTKWGGNISTPSGEQGKSRDHAATMFNTNGRYVSDAKRIAQQSPQVFAQMKRGEITMQQARQEARKQYNQKTTQWTQSEIERREMVEDGLAVLVNRNADHQLIAWAERRGIFVNIGRGSEWGNPFRLDADGTRQEVVKKYAWYYEKKPSLQRQIQSLAGKVLGCWCYPAPCHGSVLLCEVNDGY